MVAGMRGKLCLLELQTKRWQCKGQEDRGQVQLHACQGLTYAIRRILWKQGSAQSCNRQPCCVLVRKHNVACSHVHGLALPHPVRMLAGKLLHTTN